MWIAVFSIAAAAAVCLSVAAIVLQSATPETTSHETLGG